MSVADRLERALEQRDESIRGFQRRMAERDVRGSSYPSVHGYVRGDATPSVEFLRQAADVLGVREEWLVLGKGEPTAPEQGLSGLRRSGSGSPERLRERICSAHPEVARMHVAEQEVFMTVLARYAMSAPDAAELPMSEQGVRRLVELAGDLLFLIELPLHPLAWGFRELDADDEARRYYQAAVLNTLSLLMEERGQGEAVERADVSWIRELRRRAERMVEEQEEDGEQIFRRF